MKAHTLALTLLAVLLSVLLSTWVNSKAHAEARPIRQAQSSSSSQALGDLQADKKIPQKKVDSSFRRVPPSTSNPIQNK
ncbi:hypothetical protein PTKIN_Ptkin13bG0093100 [Pterospermum kingtungense]